MGKADKRARKRQNQQIAREEREAALKKAKRNRTAMYSGGGLALVIIVIAIASFTSSDPKKKAATTTTTPGASTTVAPVCPTVKKPAKTSNAKTYKTAPAMTISATKKYTAVITTSCGAFTAELASKDSPKGVNNFVFLAREGFYDGIKFHRAVSDFVIQGGDPTGSGNGGPGYSVVTEWPKQDFKTGDLAWAKTGAEKPGTARSQFFVTTGNPAALNGTKKGKTYDYGYFGHVTSGLDIAKKIESLAPPGEGGLPTTDVYILSIKITEQ